MSLRERTHVVVIGAGFGGLTAARRLARAADRHHLHVTVVDRHNYHTFQPLLYQVATAGLQPQDIGHNVRSIFGLRGVRSRRRARTGRAPPVAFRMAEVTGVDLADRRVEVADGAALRYDALIVAAGAATADYGIDGVAEHAFPLKSIEESMALRNHVLRRFEEVEGDPGDSDGGELTFVIAGGGPTGVELAGAMAELVDGPLRRDHPDLDLSRVRIILVEMLDTLLPPYSAPSRRYARRELEGRGVDVRLGTAIEEVTDRSVLLDSGERVPTRTVVWTAGVEAAPLAARMGLEQTDGGRVPVAPDLSVPGHPEVWVVGDMAGARDRDGRLYPQLAPVAIQQGKHAVKQLLRRHRGRSTRAFRYLDKGTMATVGRAAAVTELPAGVRFTGFPAWVAWLVLHLLYLVGFRNRVAVFLSWLWNYLTYDRSARLILDDPRHGDGMSRDAGGVSLGGEEESRDAGGVSLGGEEESRDAGGVSLGGEGESRDAGTD